MTDRDDLNDVAEIAECCVLSDLADTFRLGIRCPPCVEEKPIGSRFCKTLRRRGEYWADLSSVGVPTREPARGVVMKPYRSIWAPSRSSQSSRPPANSESFFEVSRYCDKELTDLGTKEAGARRVRLSLQCELRLAAAKRVEIGGITTIRKGRGGWRPYGT